MDGAALVRRINGERVVLLGWSRAILLQLAHPLVGAGVAQHSAFRGTVSEGAVRLHNTVAAMLALTFGDATRRQAALDRILAIHRRVNGTLPEAAGPFPAGTRYSAEDPALLLWVQATLVDSNLRVYERLVAPLAPAERDAVCAASMPLLDELGGDTAGAPQTWRALTEYMDAIMSDGTLAVTPAVRAIGTAVLSPSAGRWPVPFGRLHTLLGAGLLPPRVREQYGFEWSPQLEARFARWMGIIRRARRVTPDVVARFSEARRQERA